MVRDKCTIGPTYLQSVFSRIQYDHSQDRLSLTLRQSAAEYVPSVVPCLSQPVAPEPDTNPELLLPGRLPRLSRLMALALKCEGLLQSRVTQRYRDLAFLGRVSKARVTQIMNLLHLAPDIQECLLFLPPTTLGRDPISERQLREITKLVDWSQQRERFTLLYTGKAEADCFDEARNARNGACFDGAAE